MDRALTKGLATSALSLSCGTVYAEAAPPASGCSSSTL
jgi:hypothetical protein